MKWGEGNISKIQRMKAKGTISSYFLTIDEKDETHQMMMEIEPQLIASGYRTYRNILLTHGPDQAQKVTILLVSAILSVKKKMQGRLKRRWPCQLQSN